MGPAGLTTCLATIPDCVQYAQDEATPLRVAVRRGNVDCVRVLLGAGADANAGVGSSFSCMPCLQLSQD